MLTYVDEATSWLPSLLAMWSCQHAGGALARSTTSRSSSSDVRRSRERSHLARHQVAGRQTGAERRTLLGWRLLPPRERSLTMLWTILVVLAIIALVLFILGRVRGGRGA